MPDLGGLPPLRDVIAAHGLSARKGLGQHFLLDLNLTGRIARASGDLAGKTAIEVGPGPGGLTRALLDQGAQHVIAIEKDGRCREALAGLIDAADGRLTLIDADALEADEMALVRDRVGEPAKGIHIVANLPYNVGTVLIVKWLRQIAADPQLYANLVLTLQKEVADRIVAAPRTKAYGRLSVMTQWLCEAEPVFEIPARAFTPPPKVTSTVIRLTPRAHPLAEAEWGAMEDVVRAAFGQRRKMLRASLKSALAGGNVAALLKPTGIDSSARAETLDIGQFCALARALYAIRARADGPSQP